MYIKSTGMVSPVGFSAEASCAAMRAGIANFVELPYTDNSGEPIIGGTIHGLDFKLDRSERIIEILLMAIKDCLSTDEETIFESVPLLVGMAEEGRPGGINLPIVSIIEKIEMELGIRFNSGTSRTINKGHTSGFEALRLSRKLLHDSRINACLVCGVDSYINASSLLWLDSDWRLKTRNNSDGVIPGEAAAAVLVSDTQENGLETVASVTALGFGFEKANVLSDDPLLGIGLSEAAILALKEAGLYMHQIDFRISDVTGESYGFKEQSLVIARLLRVHREYGFPLWHCAENIGDTGAASGTIQM